MTHTKEVRRTDEVGVNQVFMVKAKMRKNSVPLIFMVVTKKGTLPQYFKYEDLKKDFPYFLIDFLENKLNIRNLRELNANKEDAQKDRSSNGNEKREKRQGSRDNRENRERSKEHRESFMKEKDSREISHIKEPRERQTIKQVVIKEKEQKEVSVRQMPKVSKEEPRPIRSCRIRNDLLKRKQELDMRDEGREMIRSFDEEEPLPDPPSSKEEETDEKQFKRKSFKKILDYDTLIDDLGLFNLVSPAVIPTSKTKTEMSFVNYNMPARINFKETDREQYSSEQFKESQESEFVLDDRGKEKRRKEKLMREQQRLNKKRKAKKIKKKKKSGHRQ